MSFAAEIDKDQVLAPSLAGGVTGMGLGAVFTNQATLNQSRPAPVVSVTQENNARLGVNQEALTKINAAAQALKETPVVDDPAASGPQGMGVGQRVAAVGLNLAAGAIMATVMPVMPIVTTLSNVTSFAPLFAPASGKGNENDGLDDAWRLNTPSNKAKAAAPSKVFGAQADVNAFAGAGMLGERAEIAEQSLTSEMKLNLKAELDDQRALYESSMQNAQAVQAALQQRAEHGVAVTKETVSAALETGQLDKIQKNAVYGV
jgi:hypothetical protein